MLSYTKQKEYITPNVKSRIHYQTNGQPVFKNAANLKDKNGQKQKSHYQIKKTQIDLNSKCTDESHYKKAHLNSKKKKDSALTCKYSVKCCENRDFMTSSFAKNCRKSTLKSFKFQEKVQESNKPHFQWEEGERFMTNKNQTKVITVVDMSHSSDSDSSECDSCDGQQDKKTQSQIVFSKSTNLTGEAKNV